MKKSFNLKKSLALVLALGFSASCLVQVQAGPGPRPPVRQNPIQTVELKIKKVLNLPSVDVKTPEVEFKFKFEQHSFNAKEDQKAKCPAIGDQSVKYAAKETEAADDKDAKKNGVQLIQTTGDALKGVDFTEAGQYTYKVTEEEKTLTGLVCSKAEYLVSIFVKTKADNKFTVDNIQIKKTKDDKGQAVTEQKTQYDGSTDESNKFEFDNNYDPKAGNDNPTGTDITNEDKKGFVLKKKVAGEAGKVNANEPFTFNFTVSKPAGSNAADTDFDYKIVNAQGVAGDKKTANYGTPFDVVLHHGDRVVFANVLLGSMVKAKETIDAGYTHSLEGSKMNNVAVTNVTDIEDTGKNIGDKGDNSIIFVNTQQTPTGILLNSLPFIVLALVALAGIVFFVKNRKHDDLEA